MEEKVEKGAKGEKEEKTAKQETKSIPLKTMLFILVPAFIIILAVVGFFVYSGLKSSQKDLSFENSTNILSALIDLEKNIAYVKINQSSFDDFIGIKFFFNDTLANQYIFETNILNNSYEINLSEITAINNTKELNYISYEWIKKIIPAPVTTYSESNNASAPIISPKETKDDSSKTPSDKQTTPSDDNDENCTPEYDCSDYPGSCAKNLDNGCDNVLDCRNNCASGKYCYTGEEYKDKCIDKNLTCIDSDMQDNPDLFGNLTYCSIIKINSTMNSTNITIDTLECKTLEDSCINNSAVDYSCYFNITNFIAKEKTTNCSYKCTQGACIKCENDIGCTKAGKYFCQGNTPYECIVNSSTGCLSRINASASCGANFVCVNNSVGCQSLVCVEDSDCSYFNSFYCSENISVNKKGICNSSKKCQEQYTQYDCSLLNADYCLDILKISNKSTCTTNISEAYCSVIQSNKSCADSSICTTDTCSLGSCLNSNITSCSYFSFPDCHKNICSLDCAWDDVEGGCLELPDENTGSNDAIVEGTASSISFWKSIINWFKNLF